jgi:hypothetical protein
VVVGVVVEDVEVNIKTIKVIMKNIICIVIFLLSLSTINYGQQKSNPKNNTISLEIGRVGLIYNTMFSHIISNKNYGYKFTVGSNFAKYQKVVQAGAGAYYLKGSKNNFIELGVDLNYLNYYEVSNDQRGINLLLLKKYTKTLYSNVNLGYQYSNNSNLFRVGISPGVMNTGFVLGGYMSFGFRL